MANGMRDVTTALIVTGAMMLPGHVSAQDVEQVQPGTHITAVGSDTHDKQELDAEILSRAELVVADSISQCLERGEIHQALKSNAITEAGLVELGSIIAGDATGRESDDQVTVADLTGVAVQDIQISKAVLVG